MHYRLLPIAAVALAASCTASVAGEAEQQKIAELEKRVAALEQAVLALQAQLAANQVAQNQPAVQGGKEEAKQPEEKKADAVPVVYREAVILPADGVKASLSDRDKGEEEIEGGVRVLVEREAFIGATGYFPGYLSSFVYVLTGKSKGKNLWVRKDALKETGMAKPRPAPHELLAEERAILQEELNRITRAEESALTIDKIEQNGAVLTTLTGAQLRITQSGRKFSASWQKGDRLLLKLAGANYTSLWYVSLKSKPEDKFLIDRCAFTDAIAKIHLEQGEVLTKLKAIEAQMPKP